MQKVELVHETELSVAFVVVSTLGHEVHVFVVLS
jgi:hypothetical protein